jgi:hypothetical protein
MHYITMLKPMDQSRDELRWMHYLSPSAPVSPRTSVLPISRPHASPVAEPEFPARATAGPKESAVRTLRRTCFVLCTDVDVCQRLTGTELEHYFSRELPHLCIDSKHWCLVRDGAALLHGTPCVVRLIPKSDLAWQIPLTLALRAHESLRHRRIVQLLGVAVHEVNCVLLTEVHRSHPLPTSH